MSAIILTIFVASVAGSLHCAGMCGAFMLFAIGAGEERQQHAWRLHAAYHLGRLLTYVVFGAVAGAIDATIEFGGRLIGVQRGAAIAAAACMIVTGLIMLARSGGVRLPHLPAPKALQRVASRGYKAIGQQTPMVRALGTGLLTTLLPCGWLYIFVVAAAGTGHPLSAATTMAVFWVGTLPVLIALGTGVRTLLGPFAKRVPMVAALAIVAVGVLTIFNRASMIDRTPRLFEAISQGSSPLSSQGDAAASWCDDGS